MRFFYTTKGEKEFLIYVENELYAKHRHLPIIKSDRVLSNNFFPSALASESGQSAFDSYVLLHHNEEYLMCYNLAERTHRSSNCAACILTGASLYFTVHPELPKN